MRTLDRTRVGHAVRLLVGSVPFGGAMSLLVLELAVFSVVFSFAWAKLLFIVGLVVLLLGVPFDTLIFGAIIGGVLVGIGHLLYELRKALRAGLRAEPATMLYRTRPPSGDDEQAVQRRVERLCLAADVTAPAVRIRDGNTPLCYTVKYPSESPPEELLEATEHVNPPGITRYGPSPGPRIATDPIPDSHVLVVSNGLVDRLSDDELHAVLAHEVGHLANMDLALMNWLFLPYYVVAHADDRATFVSLPVEYLVYISVVVINRGREYAADAAATRLTGDPGVLASALESLDGQIHRPAADIRAVGVVNVLPALGPEDSRLAAWAHPSTERRIERLQSMA